MLTDDTTIEARAVVIATGARYRSLPLDRWAEFERGHLFRGDGAGGHGLRSGPGRGRRRGELRRPGGAVSRRTRQRRHPDHARQSALLGATWAELGRRPLPSETSQPLVFAIGDVRSRSMKRVAAAVGDSASAIRSVHTALGSVGS